MPEINELSVLKSAHLRIARPTDNLSEVVKFYTEALGFEVIGQFESHRGGFDGVMLGHQGSDYHLEFTSKRGHKAGKAPTLDNLLVFYVPDSKSWLGVTTHIEKQGHSPVDSFNPYWDRLGKTYEDPDGYRVVIQNAEWSP